VEDNRTGDTSAASNMAFMLPPVVRAELEDFAHDFLRLSPSEQRRERMRWEALAADYTAKQEATQWAKR
jgi:hypothetical protein